MNTVILIVISSISDENFILVILLLKSFIININLVVANYVVDQRVYQRGSVRVNLDR